MQLYIVRMPDSCRKTDLVKDSPVYLLTKSGQYCFSRRNAVRFRSLIRAQFYATQFDGIVEPFK